MADDVKVTNWPEDGSKARVAFELMRIVMNAEKQYENTNTGTRPDRKYLLDLYAECLTATKGHR